MLENSYRKRFTSPEQFHQRFFGDRTGTTIKLKTADIRKAYKFKLPDAIIAGTALVYDLTLLSRNMNDFKNIAGLKIINPWDL
jgi:predicted nucleic acid-binding protein